MNKQEKNEVIEVLKEKFSQYNNFYITDTESLSVEQISNLRRACFDKQVEMRVAKNTLIRKALESLDAEKYRTMAGELVAAIRVNVMRGTFATATIDEVDQWLYQWTKKF
jgi:ribosomal protein L10